MKKSSVFFFFSVLENEWTDTMAVEELSVSVVGRRMAFLSEYFLDIVPLKKAYAESIYLVLVSLSKTKSSD